MDQVKGNVDILVMSGTKVDELFPEEQFQVPDFTAPF